MGHHKILRISASLILLGSIFFADLVLAPGVPVAIFYIIPLILASNDFRDAHILIFAIAASLLTLIGWWLSHPEVPQWIVFFNRLITLSIIWIMATMLLRWKKLKQGLKGIVRERSRQLKETRDSLHSILRSIPDGLLLIDKDGDIQFANDQISDILGHSPEDVVGRNCYEFIPPSKQEKYKSQFSDFLEKSKKPVSEEGEYVPIIKQDGSESQTEVSLSAVHAWDNSLLLLSIKDANARKLKEDQEKVIQRELKHRIANTISLLMSLVRLSAFKEDSVHSFARNLEKRIFAFSRMQDLLRNTSNPEKIGLKDLIQDIIAPFDYSENSRVSINAPDCQVDKSLAQLLYLVLFELAANSAKYGAFSTPRGQLTVNCEIQSTIVIDWNEDNVSLDVEANRQGFGTRLIDSVVKDQLQGTIERRFEKDGLKVTLEIPTDDSKIFMPAGTKNKDAHDPLHDSLHQGYP